MEVYSGEASDHGFISITIGTTKSSLPGITIQQHTNATDEEMDRLQKKVVERFKSMLFDLQRPVNGE